MLCQIVPWKYADHPTMNLKRTDRRQAFLMSRLASNLGVASTTPLLDRFASPVTSARTEQRWLVGFHLDRPDEWDDPYRFFRW